mgnify:CR=1 FL=1
MFYFWVNYSRGNRSVEGNRRMSHIFDPFHVQIVVESKGSNIYFYYTIYPIILSMPSGHLFFETPICVTEHVWYQVNRMVF